VPASERPARASVIPPANDRRSAPHRERDRHQGMRESLMGDGRQSRPVSEPPPRLYMSEVKRASLLPDDFDDLPPHMQAMLSAPPPSGPPIGISRPSFNPDTNPTQLERRSLPPNQYDSSASPARRSLNPLASLKSLLPGGRSEGQDEDPRFQNAITLRRQNRKVEAMMALEELRRMKPDYPQARELLFTIALELGSEDRVRQHADWMIAQHNQQQNLQAVCATYRSIRMACPNLSMSEKTLIAVLVAADKSRDGRSALDVTKLMLRDYPASAHLPRAFMSSAHVQIAEGRPDLARATLENLIVRFPYDTLAVQAKKKLNELA
jgi:hypothetical protein